MTELAMHDLLAEETASLSKAMRWVPSDDGRHPSPSTGWRWCREGIVVGGQRVKLEYIRAGRKILTTKEALSRFFSRLAEADGEHVPGERIADPAPARPQSHREKQIEAAAARLSAAGI